MNGTVIILSAIVIIVAIVVGYYFDYKSNPKNFMQSLKALISKKLLIRMIIPLGIISLFYKAKGIPFIKKNVNSVEVKQTEIPIPAGYSIVESAIGDLTKDGIDELVVVYNTKEPEKDYDNIPRELIVYRLGGDKWKRWKSSENAIYGSKYGGGWGDPFAEMQIKNGILIITHFGGSSWKWSLTDKYRYQNNDFYLIGYTSDFGKPCEYWTEVDYNLSTGKVNYSKEFEDCEEEQKVYKTEKESFYKKNISFTIQNRNTQEIKFTTPKYKEDIYLSTNLFEQ